MFGVAFKELHQATNTLERHQNMGTRSYIIIYPSIVQTLMEENDTTSTYCEK